MDQRPLDRFGGCVAVIVGSWFSLIAGLFLVVGVLTHLNVLPVQGNPPGWEFFVVPVVFLAIGVGVFRYGRWNLTRPRPPAQPVDPAVREAGRTMLPIALGFLAVGVLSMGGAFAALIVFNAPFWVMPLVFFTPPVVYFFLVRGAIHRAAARWARAAPSPESLAADPTDAPKQPVLPDLPQPTLVEGDWPTVPAVETNPGSVLAHALNPDDPHRGCGFGCALVMAAFWNGIVAVFAVPIVRQLLRGNVPDNWWVGLFLIPFVIVGAILIGMTVWAGYRWVVGLLIGSVTVEVSGHPLAPGQRYEVRLAQRGAFRLGGVVVELVCEEQATYVAGTDKNTAKKEVVRRPVETSDTQGLPLTAGFEVPTGAMHSFESPNNEIVWTLQVTGRALGVLPYEETYTVTVRPE